MSNSLNSKKKEQPLNETFYNLCKSLLRFIDRKIIKKYVFPNPAQLPKEQRGSERISINQGRNWTYFYKEGQITEEDKVKDVFKDEKFLGYLQNLTSSLLFVVDYLEQNINIIKSYAEDTKNKEEKLNSLNELKNLLNNYFDKNEDNRTSNGDNKYDILKNRNLLDIMNKLQSSSNTNQNNISDPKLTQNIIEINKIGSSKSNVKTSSNNLEDKNKIVTNFNDNGLDNPIINNTKQIENNQQIIDNNDLNSNVKAKGFLEDKKEMNNKCLSAPNPNNINEIKNESIKSEPDSEDKNKLNNYIDSYKITLFNKEKMEKNSNEEEKSKLLPKNIDSQKDNTLLNKKKEREKNDDKEEIKSNINIGDAPSSEKKKRKNKKNKNKNNNESQSNTNQIPLKEKIQILPEIKLKEEKRKVSISFEPEFQENEEQSKDEIDFNKIKKGIKLNDINLLFQKGKNNEIDNLSLEEEFDSGIKKELYDLDPNNNRIKTIKDILSLIKNNNIQNYNPRIKGPILVGSYRTVPDLPSINYFAPIDIMYTYKDILIDKKIADYTINNLITNHLNLNIVERSLGQHYDDKNNITKIIVKCTSEVNLSLIISFNIYFMDIGVETNETILNNFIFGADKMKFENKDIEKKYINTILFLRIWRKKNKLFFIIPEILDEIVKHFFQENTNTGVSILNVFYCFYDLTRDFNSRKHFEDFPKNKSLIEKIVKTWFEDEKPREMIIKSVLETIIMINNKKYSEIFNNYEYE